MVEQVVELMQKPSLRELVDAVEDKGVYEELKSLNIDVNRIRVVEPNHGLVIDLLERLKKILLALLLGSPISNIQDQCSAYTKL